MTNPTINSKYLFLQEYGRPDHIWSFNRIVIKKATILELCRFQKFIKPFRNAPILFNFQLDGI